jgi:hypothetical protein
VDEIRIEHTVVVYTEGVPRAVIHGEQPIVEALRASAESAGYATAPGQIADDGSIEVADDAVCSVEDPRPCEIRVALGTIADLAEAAGVPPNPIARLEGQRITEAEAAAAAEATIAAMPPGPERADAELWYEVAFAAPNAAAPVTEPKP